jgi:hypothetical protein
MHGIQELQTVTLYISPLPAPLYYFASHFIYIQLDTYGIPVVSSNASTQSSKCGKGDGVHVVEGISVGLSHWVFPVLPW